MKKFRLVLALVAFSFIGISSTWAIMAPQYDVFDTREQLENSGQLGVCSVVSDGCSEWNVVDGVIGDPIKMCKVAADFKFQWSCTTGNPDIMYMTGGPIVGGDIDSHGCKPSTGYTWDALANACLRSWEENVSSFSQNDQNQYATFKENLGDTVNTKIDTVVSKYEEKLLKFTKVKRAKLNKEVIALLESRISQFLLKFPADTALSNTDNKKYMLMTVLKYKLMLVEGKIDSSLSTK